MLLSHNVKHRSIQEELHQICQKARILYQVTYHTKFSLHIGFCKLKASMLEKRHANKPQFSLQLENTFISTRKFCSIRIKGFHYSYFNVRVMMNDLLVPLLHSKGNNCLHGG